MNNQEVKLCEIKIGSDVYVAKFVVSDNTLEISKNGKLKDTTCFEEFKFEDEILEHIFEYVDNESIELDFNYCKAASEEYISNLNEENESAKNQHINFLNHERRLR